MSHAMIAYIAARTVEDGDCLLWTRGCANGHPSARIDGKEQLVRRVLQEQASGPISPGKVLRVTCGNTKCLSRDHWTITTHRRIALDCSAKGLMGGQLRAAKIAAAKRFGPQAKITQDDARAIRASDLSGAALAKRYSISGSTVSKIKRGQVRREFAGNVWAGLA